MFFLYPFDDHVPVFVVFVLINSEGQSSMTCRNPYIFDLVPVLQEAYTSNQLDAFGLYVYGTVLVAAAATTGYPVVHNNQNNDDDANNSNNEARYLYDCTNIPNGRKSNICENAIYSLEQGSLPNRYINIDTMRSSAVTTLNTIRTKMDQYISTLYLTSSPYNKYVSGIPNN